jgi:hypothetical protein
MTTRLEHTARALVVPTKGILAADESHATIGRRFAAVGVANTEEARRQYRQMLVTTPGIACPSPKRRRTPLRGEPDFARITAHADRGYRLNHELTDLQ